MIAIAILAGAIVATAAAYSATMDVRGRYFSDNIDKYATPLASQTGISLDEARAQVSAVFDNANSGFEITLEAWVWVGVAAGLVAIAGGLLDLAWVREERLRWMRDKPT